MLPSGARFLAVAPRDNRPVSQTRSGYRQSFGGLIGALVAVFVVIGFVWALGWFQHRPLPNPTPTVNYSAALSAARQEAPFHVLAPERLPAGWRATSVNYAGVGRDISWHLGFLTAGNQYVGLEQGNGPSAKFVALKTKATRTGPTVRLGDQSWTTMTSASGSERALVHRAGGETVVVTGTATLRQMEGFASSLR